MKLSMNQNNFKRVELNKQNPISIKSFRVKYRSEVPDEACKPM